jgi:hypothetical protein
MTKNPSLTYIHSLCAKCHAGGQTFTSSRYAYTVQISTDIQSDSENRDDQEIRKVRVDETSSNDGGDLASNVTDLRH